MERAYPTVHCPLQALLLLHGKHTRPSRACDQAVCDGGIWLPLLLNQPMLNALLLSNSGMSEAISQNPPRDAPFPIRPHTRFGTEGSKLTLFDLRI